MTDTRWVAVLEGPNVDETREFRTEAEATEWCDEYLARESTNIARETAASVQRIGVETDNPPADTEAHGHRTGEGCMICSICDRCMDPTEMADVDLCNDCAGDLTQQMSEAHAESLGDMMRDEGGGLT